MHNRRRCRASESQTWQLVATKLVYQLLVVANKMYSTVLDAGTNIGLPRSEGYSAHYRVLHTTVLQYAPMSEGEALRYSVRQ